MWPIGLNSPQSIELADQSQIRIQNLAFEPFVKRFLSLWAKCSKSIKLFCKKRRPKLFSNRGKVEVVFHRHLLAFFKDD